MKVSYVKFIKIFYYFDGNYMKKGISYLIKTVLNKNHI